MDRPIKKQGKSDKWIHPDNFICSLMIWGLVEPKRTLTTPILKQKENLLNFKPNSFHNFFEIKFSNRNPLRLFMQSGVGFEFFQA